MAGEIIEIKSVEMLWRIYKSPKRKGVYLRLSDHFHSHIKTTFELSINKYYSDCGCETGSIGLASALTLIVITLTIDILLNEIRHFSFYLCLILIGLITGALLGKIIGLRVARINLYKTIKFIEANTLNFHH